MDGRKDDAGKARWDLLPFRALLDVIRVLEHGAIEYGPNNWRNVAQAKIRYFNAAIRHLVARFRGELLDPKSGLPHLAHAACNCLFLAEFDMDAEPPRTDGEPQQESVTCR